MSGDGLGGLSRERLAGRVLLHLKRGGPLRPDVVLAVGDAGPLVVKDWAPRARWVRASLGRWALRREVAAHRRLAGVACVPRLLGRLDAQALVLEYRAGMRVGPGRPWLFDARFAAGLSRAVVRLHERGVLHLDLAHRGNVGADAQGGPLVFDLGAALCLPRGPLGRWIRGSLGGVDRRALRKWQRRLAAAGAGAQRSGASSGAASEGARGESRPT